MASCEMCGRKEAELMAEVEGTNLKVCSNCARYGKVLKKVNIPAPKKAEKKLTEEKKQEEPELIEVIVPDYSKRIKDRREKLGLTHEELAKKLAEKESLIQKIENAKMLPSLSLAQKIERILHIKLIETIAQDDRKFEKSPKSAEFTIGDLIKTRKKN